MELKTKSKRPNMNCSIDVFFEKKNGFSEYLNDRSTYKIVLVKSGSFVVEENGEYRVVTAPVGIGINEKADFKVVSENDVVTSTIYFKPTFIREEFTFEAIDSGKYNKLFCDLKEGENHIKAIEGDVQLDEGFAGSVYQEYLYLTDAYCRGRDTVYYSMTQQELDSVNRLVESVRYDLFEQPDNLWILRVWYFLLSILFVPTADFYINWRQYELYSDQLVAKVASYFWNHLGDEITLDSILKRFSVNKNTLNEAFNKEFSMSCMAYLEKQRIDQAKKLLQFGDESVSEISQFCGYSETGYFSKVFKKHTGQSPSEYRRQMQSLC
ncbi:MAG: helix-turn-helix transcriptional regulator [Bacillus sp. (in: Bacteria)]|nr:helix-turn-helix transcriptional regulator [Bacillus sp. (in: firmicutes)]